MTDRLAHVFETYRAGNIKRVQVFILLQWYVKKTSCNKRPEIKTVSLFVFQWLIPTVEEETTLCDEGSHNMCRGLWWLDDNCYATVAATLVIILSSRDRMRWTFEKADPALILSLHASFYRWLSVSAIPPLRSLIPVLKQTADSSLSGLSDWLQ